MFGKFNYLEESSLLIVDIVLLWMMYNSHPRKTVNFKYDKYGCLAAVPANIAMIAACVLIDYFSLQNFKLLTVILAVHTMLYAFLLQDLFLYIYFLPLKNRNNEKRKKVGIIFLGIDIVLTAVCEIRLAILVNTPGITAQMLFYKYIRYISCLGLILVIVIFIYVLIIRKYLIRVIRYGIIGALPFVALLLIYQYKFPHVLLLSLTYVVPFMLFYLYFHSNPYDELTGFQNAASMENRFESNIRAHSNFYYGWLIIPELEKGTIDDMNVLDTSVITQVAMAIENLSPKMHLYRVSRGVYNSFLEMSKSEKADSIYIRSAEIASELLRHFYYNYPLHTQIVGFYVYDGIKSLHMAKAFTSDIIRRSDKQGESLHHLADEEDYRIFMKHYTVSDALENIAISGDLDDERILCYAQPIYDVQSGTFRTAEALMRMSLDGEVIPPGVFIPIAEENNNIHILTLIMLNKVCRQISEMGNSYEYDAITVNCSSKEFSRPYLYREFMDIINRYHIDPKKIRFELTESAMFDNPEEVKANMDVLHNNGINLYLDDFGTGYSSVERIVSFPFNTIKFDKSMLDKSMEDSRMDDITSYMVNAFKKDGFGTLVEGVEDDEGVSYSKEKGFDFIQGFYYARPVPIEKLTEYFKHAS